MLVIETHQLARFRDPRTLAFLPFKIAHVWRRAIEKVTRVGECDDDIQSARGCNILHHAQDIKALLFRIKMQYKTAYH